MRHFRAPLLTLALALTASCVSGRALAVNTLAASDLAADTAAAEWQKAVGQKVADCRALELETPAARSSCLGKFRPSETDKLIAAVKALVALQLMVKVAAECEELNTCASETDWVYLATEIVEAWEALKPYVTAARESAK